jgi:short-subunit dehydrogenase
MRVLVTGVAGGIGRRVARLLLDADHDVIGVDRDANGLESVPQGVETMTLDLGDDDAVADALDSLAVDVVVSAVGWYELGALEDCPPAALREHLESNLVAVHSVVHALLPTLRQRDGRVVVVGSMAGAVPLPYHGPYGAAKAGLAGYTAALRREVEPRGVKVALVEPGPARTGFNERAAEAVAGRERSAYAERYRAFEGYSPDATDPEVVAETIVEAVQAERPNTRYRVGTRARLLPLLLAVLPDRLGDRIVRSGTPGGLLYRLIDR